MNTLLQVYNLFKKDNKKERFDIILEPLQAVTQLALLSFCPKGSKLTISNNLLAIQAPTWGQGLWRSYNHDMKEDLFFLFNAILRFNRFYSYLKTESDDYCDLFDLLIQLGKRGIDKLLQTYATTEQPALLHTLQLYRILLDKPVDFDEPDDKKAKAKAPKVVVSNKKKESGFEPSAVAAAAAAAASASASAANVVVCNASSSNSIDDIFENIRFLYTTHEFIILYQSLILLEKNPDKYETYIQGITLLMQPIYEKIQKWISDHIVY